MGELFCHCPLILVKIIVVQPLQEPWMPLDLLEGDALRGVLAEHPPDEVLALTADRELRELGLPLDYHLADLFWRPAEGKVPQHHDIKDHAEAPRIRLEREEREERKVERKKKS